jgi:Mn2+/Fe2+ NRAMP family transporter
MIGPGLLVAATGVGAGDLATGALTGSRRGTAVLWAVLVGAGLKFGLTEGLARWQLATGTTFLEGMSAYFGRFAHTVFLCYLLCWSYFVGAALMGACGVCAHAICPLFDPVTDKRIYGLGHSLVAVGLVLAGGYRLFEKVMTFCIVGMFITVVLATCLIQPDWRAVGRGLVVPSIPSGDGSGLEWTIALLGGVGGTLTILCYGYWIREAGRSDSSDLKSCRIDLAVGYTMTAIFGIAMVILGSRLSQGSGKGATLIVNLADELQNSLGSLGLFTRWAFLIGAWGAIFSSLLGVWQSVPYLFADYRNLNNKRRATSHADVRLPSTSVDVNSFDYRAYLIAIATIPSVGLWMDFSQAQKLYAIVGALFIPMLAFALLILNNRESLIGRSHRNSWFTSLMLIVTLAMSLLAGWFAIQKRFGG